MAAAGCVTTTDPVPTLTVTSGSHIVVDGSDLALGAVVKVDASWVGSCSDSVVLEGEPSSCAPPYEPFDLVVTCDSPGCVVYHRDGYSASGRDFAKVHATELGTMRLSVVMTSRVSGEAVGYHATVDVVER